MQLEDESNSPKHDLKKVYFLERKSHYKTGFSFPLPSRRMIH